MSVVDTYGVWIRPDDELLTFPGGRVCVATYFDDQEPDEGVFQGQVTGQLLVEFEDGDTERYPTFAVGADDVCYDVEKIPTD